MNKTVSELILAEKPLITFALIAYNQEKFIQEAVEAALAQDYEPLEVIFSDDCSTDSTFKLIKETVARYDGPHRVVVRKTLKNVGTFAHVMHVMKDVQGELIVLAAGDDISKRERVTQLATAWQLTGAWGLHSRFDRIDKDGNLLGVAQISEGLLRPEYRLRQYFYKEDGPVEIVHGVGSAYDVRIFEYLTDFSERFILSEDGVVSFALNLLRKKIHLLDESLVLYREHQGSLTNAGSNFKNLSEEDIYASEVKNTVYSASLTNRTKMFLELVDSIDGVQVRRVNKQEIIRDNKIGNFKATWLQSSFFDRAKFLLSCRQSSDLKWVIPRFFGAEFFIKFKFFVRIFKFLK